MIYGGKTPLNKEAKIGVKNRRNRENKRGRFEENEVEQKVSENKVKADDKGRNRKNNGFSDNDESNKHDSFKIPQEYFSELIRGHRVYFSDEEMRRNNQKNLSNRVRT